MRFYIFKWWEKWIKPSLYIMILLLTGGLFAFYFTINDQTEYYVFVISIIYALFLFFITIPINKFERYTADKLYEREDYYLALKRLREITNSTIQRANVNDQKNFEKHIREFQIFTGRDEESCSRRIAGERVPILVREKGFEYSDKMLHLETEYLRACGSKNKKEIMKKGKILKKYYSKSCKKLEKNCSRISSIYGRTLQELIERDFSTSDADYLLNGINSKIDNLISEISSLRINIDEIADLFGRHQNEISDSYEKFDEKLTNIESAILDITNDL